MRTGRYQLYWAETSSNGLVSNLIREGSVELKEQFKELLSGGIIQSPIDEQIIYSQLGENEKAVWSLLLDSGYLKLYSHESYNNISGGVQIECELALTNLEVKFMFQKMIRNWFMKAETDYNDFVKALLRGDEESMDGYMKRLTLKTYDYFHTGKAMTDAEMERFCHGFVLRLIIDLQNRYIITTNRESGNDGYDVVLEPKDVNADDAFILEFKVRNRRREETLEDTVQLALQHIEQKQYAAQLIERGIPKERIRSYGFAFEGKQVLIG